MQPELKLNKTQALQGPILLFKMQLNMINLIRVFFPCWCFTGPSFPAGASHGLLSVLVLHMVKFCQNNQTMWSPLINVSQAMTPSLPQAIFFSYAPLQKIAMKSCKQISKNYLSCVLKLNVLIGDNKYDPINF